MKKKKKEKKIKEKKKYKEKPQNQKSTGLLNLQRSLENVVFALLCGIWETLAYWQQSC